MMKGRTYIEAKRRAAGLTLIACVLPLCGCLSRDLQSGLSEQDAQEIVVVLKQNGLEAYPVREAGGDRDAAPAWTVKVKGGGRNLLAAWQVMQENGLPRQKVKGLEEVFATKGMIPTASEEKARMLLALSGELTRTLKSVTGVVDARVQVVLPENSPLLDKSQWSLPTASVLVKHRGSAPPLTEDEVRSLVARGVEGLQPENVAVIYKRIAATSSRNRDIGWYLSDAYVVIGSLVLAALTSVGALVLIIRSQRQKAAIASLRRDLEAAACQSREQLAEAGRV
jgi:type III secretion protein J